MAIVFQILVYMYPSNKYYGPKLSVCFGFKRMFFTLTNLESLVSNMTIVLFRTLLKNTQITYFWSQVLHDTLRFDKFESADFKYDNNFLKLLPKTPKNSKLLQM